MVANPEKGETQITIQGVDYVLAWSFNSLVSLQQMFTRDGVRPTAKELFLRAQAEDYEVSRAIFWGLFKRHHPDVTLQDAGDLITSLGGVTFMNEFLSAAIDGSAPTSEDIAALGGAKGNPPKAAKATRRSGRTGGR